jgi:WD40 repeat protein
MPTGEGDDGSGTGLRRRGQNGREAQEEAAASQEGDIEEPTQGGTPAGANTRGQERAVGDEEAASASDEAASRREVALFDDARALLAWRREYTRSPSPQLAAPSGSLLRRLLNCPPLDKLFPGPRGEAAVGFPPDPLAALVSSDSTPHAQVAAISASVMSQDGSAEHSGILVALLRGSCLTVLCVKSGEVHARGDIENLFPARTRRRDQEEADSNDYPTANDDAWNRLSWNPDGSRLVCVVGDSLVVVGVQNISALVSGKDEGRARRRTHSARQAVVELKVDISLSLNEIGLAGARNAAAMFIRHGSCPSLGRNGALLMEIVLLGFDARVRRIHLSDDSPQEPSETRETTCRCSGVALQVVPSHDLSEQSPPSAACLSSDGVLVVGYSDGQLCSFALDQTVGSTADSLQVVLRTNMDSSAVRLRFSPDDQRLLAIGGNGSVEIFDVTNFRNVATVRPVPTQALNVSDTGDVRGDSGEICDAQWWPDERLYDETTTLRYASADHLRNQVLLLSFKRGGLAVWDTSRSLEANLESFREESGEDWQPGVTLSSVIEGSGSRGPLALVVDCSVSPAVDSERALLEPLPESSGKRKVETNWMVVSAVFWLSLGFVDLADPAGDAAVAARMASKLVRRVERMSLFTQVTPEEILESKLASGNYDSALLLADAHGLSPSPIYKAQWRDALGLEFESHHLYSPLTPGMIEDTLGKLEHTLSELFYIVDAATGTSCTPRTCDEALMLLDFAVERLWSSPFLKLKAETISPDERRLGLSLLLCLGQRDRIRTLSAILLKKSGDLGHGVPAIHNITATEASLSDLKSKASLRWFRFGDLRRISVEFARRCEFVGLSRLLERHFDEIVGVDGALQVFDHIPLTCHPERYVRHLLSPKQKSKPWRTADELHPLEDPAQLQALFGLEHAFVPSVVAALRNAAPHNEPANTAPADDVVDWVVRRARRIERRTGLTGHALTLMQLCAGERPDLRKNHEFARLETDLEQLLTAQKGSRENVSLTLGTFQSLDSHERLRAVLSNVPIDHVVARLAKIPISLKLPSDISNSEWETHPFGRWICERARAGEIQLCTKVVGAGPSLIPATVVNTVIVRLCYDFPRLSVTDIGEVRQMCASLDINSADESEANLATRIECAGSLSEYSITVSSSRDKGISLADLRDLDEAHFLLLVDTMCAEVARNSEAAVLQGRKTGKSFEIWEKLLTQLLSLSKTYDVSTTHTDVPRDVVFERFFAAVVRARRISLIRKLLRDPPAFRSFSIGVDAAVSVLVDAVIEAVNASAGCGSGEISWQAARDLLQIATECCDASTSPELSAKQALCDREMALMDAFESLSSKVSADGMLPMVPVQVRLLSDRQTCVQLAVMGDNTQPAWIPASSRLPALNDLVAISLLFRKSQGASEPESVVREQVCKWLVEAHLQRAEFRSAMDLLAPRYSSSADPLVCMTLAQSTSEQLSLDDRIELASVVVTRASDSSSRKSGDPTLQEGLRLWTSLKQQKTLISCGADAGDMSADSLRSTWATLSGVTSDTNRGPAPFGSLWSSDVICDVSDDTDAPVAPRFAATYSQKSRSRRSKRQRMEALLLGALDEASSEHMLRLASYAPTDSDAPRTARELWAFLKVTRAFVSLDGTNDDEIAGTFAQVFADLSDRCHPAHRVTVARWRVLWLARAVIEAKLGRNVASSVSEKELISEAQAVLRDIESQNPYEKEFLAAQEALRSQDTTVSLSDSLFPTLIPLIDSERFASDPESRSVQLVTLVQQVAEDLTPSRDQRVACFESIILTAAEWSIPTGGLALEFLRAVIAAFASGQDWEADCLALLRAAHPDRTLLEKDAFGEPDSVSKAARTISELRAEFVGTMITNAATAALLKWLSSLELRLSAIAQEQPSQVTQLIHKIAGGARSEGLFSFDFQAILDGAAREHSCQAVSAHFTEIAMSTESSDGTGLQGRSDRSLKASHLLDQVLAADRDASDCHCKSQFASTAVRQLMLLALQENVGSETALGDLLGPFIRELDVDGLESVLAESGHVGVEGHPLSADGDRTLRERSDFLRVRKSFLHAVKPHVDERDMESVADEVSNELDLISLVSVMMEDFGAGLSWSCWRKLGRLLFRIETAEVEHVKSLWADVIISCAVASANGSLTGTAERVAQHASSFAGLCFSEQTGLLENSLQLALTNIADELESLRGHSGTDPDRTDPLATLTAVAKWSGAAESPLRDDCIKILLALSQEPDRAASLKQILVATLEVELGAGAEAQSAASAAKHLEFISMTWGNEVAEESSADTTRVFQSDPEASGAAVTRIVSRCAARSETKAHVEGLLQLCYDLQPALGTPEQHDAVSVALRGGLEDDVFSSGTVVQQTGRLASICFGLRAPFSENVSAAAAQLHPELDGADEASLRDVIRAICTSLLLEEKASVLANLCQSEKFTTAIRTVLREMDSDVRTTDVAAALIAQGEVSIAAEIAQPLSQDADLQDFDYAASLGALQRLFRRG